MPFDLVLLLGPHKKLDDLKRQLWLTFLVHPLGAADNKDHHFDANQLQSVLDSIKSGLYQELKQRYLDFASHLEAFEEAGNLATEAGFWRAWMQSLQGAIQKTYLPSYRESGTWPTQHAVHVLVSLPFFYCTSITNTDLA